MRFLKNYKSKKQLKLENAELKKQLNTMADTEKNKITVTHFETQKIRAGITFDFLGWSEPPKNIYKVSVSKKLLEQLKPFITWEEYEMDDKRRTRIVATLEVVDRRGE